MFLCKKNTIERNDLKVNHYSVLTHLGGFLFFSKIINIYNAVKVNYSVRLLVITYSILTILLILPICILPIFITHH
jgi:hypothetical protein